ncbi:glyoxylase-like metal-dependent hydrolase (beta-lactamase superfamily II) [Peribacillus deserti]|uniref:Glyoxylase-like metal-dependent hydrolase (Beta-lactamase superfamily II) n=1 Tax=Peribacillus deserti TaxID=673318 RepID=A0ABS2QLK1_9BACI|nr:MBL fold metallo-hydrolase [Peribacillus deserti]MBM7693338.1 glyoxylase-like metal-dependent hydrolase (beta-lactamase superfamily II) [Peribacillus deserti]
MTVKPMTVKEVTKKVISKDQLFILDVRNHDAFGDWKIEGENFEYLNIPYFDLLDGVEDIVDKLPLNKQVLVVCAKEGSSVMVAEMLSETGLSVHYLKGGMKAWSEYLEPVKIGDLKGGGSLYQFVRIGKGCLSYMIESQGEAIIVDAARMTEHYETFANENNILIKHVADTHLHADHISGGRKLAEKVGGTYYIPPKDAEEVVFDFAELQEGKEILVGGTKVIVQPLYTPGHTIGSTSLLIDDKYLLTGDILFVESIGRPDLAGKAEDWVADLRESLYDRYKKLDGGLMVLPAHFSKVSELGENGKVTASLKELYERNEGLNLESDKFRTLVTDNLPPQPNSYQEIRQTNMGKLKPDEEEQREMEIGPNRCAVHN